MQNIHLPQATKPLSSNLSVMAPNLSTTEGLLISMVAFLGRLSVPAKPEMPMYYLLYLT
jgi:hypothetical protein